MYTSRDLLPVKANIEYNVSRLVKDMSLEQLTDFYSETPKGSYSEGLALIMLVQKQTMTEKAIVVDAYLLWLAKDTREKKKAVWELGAENPVSLCLQKIRYWEARKDPFSYQYSSGVDRQRSLIRTMPFRIEYISASTTLLGKQIDSSERLSDEIVRVVHEEYYLVVFTTAYAEEAVAQKSLQFRLAALLYETRFLEVYERSHSLIPRLT